MEEVIAKINQAKLEIISQNKTQIVIAKDDNKKEEINQLYQMVCNGSARSWMQYHQRYTVPNLNGYGSKVRVSKQSTGYIINF